MGSHSKIGRHGSRTAALVRTTDGSLPAPLLLQWMATLRCPLTCPHCLAATRESGFDDMPLSRVLDLIDQAADLGVGEFLVTGGEPLIREDLPEVIAHLAQRRLPWSLNTAALPNPEIQRAIRNYPPGLAAVSLDGPASVHDAFRGRPGAFTEALQALSWFSSLKSVHVVAGTTVARFNFPHLGETFRIAVASGAHAWGIHLPVPEGRAGRRNRRKHLFLARAELGSLMRFVAAKRDYFPVTMADEFGYCGDWEPLLRDLPFRCGAGVAQCVVLPDGSVVPCTTLDRSTRAGTLRDRPLADLWRDGFAELRNWKPEGRCAACRYAPACGGGCWLQRRHGMKCYQDIWRVPAAMQTAAGIALCLGMTGTPGASRADQTVLPSAAPEILTATHPPPGLAIKSLPGSSSGIADECGPGIEANILAWYGDAKNLIPAAATQDPAYAFLETMMSDQMPVPIDKLAERITTALKTDQRSLAFSALLWRATAEWCLKNDPAQRTADDHRRLRETLAAIEQATAAWRKEIFDKKLDPYLARGRTTIRHPFMMSKARRPPPPWLELVRDVQTERWGWATDRKTTEATTTEPLSEWLQRHPYAEEMILDLEVESRSGIKKISAAGTAELKTKDSLAVFDVLASGDRDVIVSIRPKVGKTVFVTLPPRTELTYVDLLQLAYSQNAASLDREAGDLLSDKPFTGRSSPWVNATSPLLMPAVMKLKKADDNPAERSLKSPRQLQADHWLADFWMF